MTAYRKHEAREPSESDRETDALVDLVARMKRFRKRLALPILIATLVAVSLGTTAHAIGYWSVIGTMSDGSYYVGTFTFAIAAVICAAPILGPGLLVYVVARARLRRAWQEEHRRVGVSKDWLDANVRRFA